MNTKNTTSNVAGPLAAILAPLVLASAQRAQVAGPKPLVPKRRYNNLPAMVAADGIVFVGSYDCN